MIKLNIDGFELAGYEGQTILDVCNNNGINVPTLCHDERVKMYGSCGVCVVEAEGSPRLLRSCSTLIAEGMIIKTNSQKITQTRKTALELLLSDHRGDCRPPCVLACPGKTDCQGYVGLIANGEYIKAAELIKDRIPMPASIGRVCPHPCETECRRKLVENPISIAALKYFAADADLKCGKPFLPKITEETGKKVAVIGGGPGGLSCAYFLRKNGIFATVYDAMPKMGGMLRYGIPEYRLPKTVVDDEVSVIAQTGVEMKNNVKIGREITIEQLQSSYDAVVIAVGAWTSMALGCKGEDAEGVVGGIDLLRQIALEETSFGGKKIAVVGGGNTAMDVCRTAVRLGADRVYNIYRRTKAEMPAEDIEIAEAEEEGVIFKNLTNPAEIISENGRVSRIKLQVMKLGEPDSSGRRAPVAVDGEFEMLDIDLVVIAIGQTLNPDGLEALTLTKKGTIHADTKTYRTNLNGVFAIGDATNKGADIAIAAIGEAREAAEVITAYLNGEAIECNEPYLVEQKFSADDFSDRKKQDRVEMRHHKPDERKSNFREVNYGYTEDEAVAEAKRCLECGCHDFFECRLIDYANSYKVEPEKYGGYVHERKKDSDNAHPFIKHDPDKCILCGLCVRICDEVIGATALGLVSRGFDTMVTPALGLPLSKTDCISCGQCVSLCPTGALIEVTGACKQVPLKEEIKASTCAFCSVGCANKLSYVGDTLLKCLPDTDKDKAALLCSKGRFGAVTKLLKLERIQKPLMRVANGVNELEERSYDDVFVAINKRLKDIVGKYGNESVKVAVSDKLTNEEIYLINKYVTEIAGLNKPFSFNGVKSGAKTVFGYNGSANSEDELINCDVIFAVEQDIMKTHTITGIRIKQACEQGKQLITLGNKETNLSQFADIRLMTDNSLDVLKQFIKALFALGCDPKNADGLDALKDYVSKTEVCEDVKKAAETYLKAKTAMLVYDESALSYEAALLISAISVISDHIGKARRGFVSLKQNCNSQGLCDMGVCQNADRHIKELEGGDVKAMLVFGEDAPIDLSGLEFCAVFDSYMTKTAANADVIVPLAVFNETDGSYTNTFRNVNRLSAATKPYNGKTNIAIISGLANAFDSNFAYVTADDVFADIRRSEAMYRELANGRTTLGGSSVLYASGFETDNGKAKLTVPAGDKMYREHCNTNVLYRKFTELLHSEGIQ